MRNSLGSRKGIPGTCREGLETPGPGEQSQWPAVWAAFFWGRRKARAGPGVGFLRAPPPAESKVARPWPLPRLAPGPQTPDSETWFSWADISHSPVCSLSHSLFPAWQLQREPGVRWPKSSRAASETSCAVSGGVAGEKGGQGRGLAAGASDVTGSALCLQPRSVESLGCWWAGM